MQTEKCGMENHGNLELEKQAAENPCLLWNPAYSINRASIKLAGIIQIIAYHQSLVPLLVAAGPNGIEYSELTMNRCWTNSTNESDIQLENTWLACLRSFFMEAIIWWHAKNLLSFKVEIVLHFALLQADLLDLIPTFIKKEGMWISYKFPRRWFKFWWKIQSFPIKVSF